MNIEEESKAGVEECVRVGGWEWKGEFAGLLVRKEPCCQYITATPAPLFVYMI